ncbi:MAG: hypothetical protein VB087_07870 [Candidatus Limiplasma sp.]|nr:hypothetical protein [Candidatus Limiplasma sp.]
MTAAEFLYKTIHGGYATRDTCRDYMQMHAEPYTDDDLQAVYRLHNYREVRDVMRAAQGEMIVVEG